jgi:hypothetical protein
VDVTADNDITMDPGTTTGTGSGDITYSADGDLTIDTLETSSGSSGGTITLEGDTLTDNNGSGMNTTGGSLVIDVPGTSLSDIQELLGSEISYRITMNDVTIGGMIIDPEVFAPLGIAGSNSMMVIIRNLLLNGMDFTMADPIFLQMR